MSDSKKLREAEDDLTKIVMGMADGIPLDIPSSLLGRELLDTLAGDGSRTPERQSQMLASALAAALKIINRSILNTPTKETP